MDAKHQNVVLQSYAVLILCLLFLMLLTDWHLLYNSEVEHRGVVLGMAQLEDKPALHSRGYITEVENEADISGQLKDAQYDDQVMVYPKWHETCKYLTQANLN